MALPSERGTSVDDLLERARRWAGSDPDPTTRRETESLVAARDLAALEAGFGTALEFGTAGLRGALGPGPGRMNRAVVRRAAAGLAAWLGPGRTVVIGRDARHGSAAFADDSARVLAAAGLDVVRLPEPGPTPLVAFAVRRVGADAGVVVTASHNPAGDNGYKVYAGDGAQIVPPVDAEIAAAIEAAPAANEIPLAPADHPRVREDASLRAAYVDHALGLVAAGPRSLRIVHTPLHGVGGDVVLEVLERAGFADVHVVAEQAEPDPDFPTVDFPNPEERGALDLALAEARAIDADLVLANDPDADRLGVAVPDGDGWRTLSGDEVGWLLGSDLLARTDVAHPLVVTTIVSDDLLEQLAADADAVCRRTLTGFKWVVRPALDDPTLDFVFGYEEALGYSVDPFVRDKDGITAALAFADLAARLAADGDTVTHRLDELAVRYGLHATRTWSVRLEGAEGRRAMTTLLRQLRDRPPKDLAGVPVERVIDYLEPDTGLPRADVLRFDAAGRRVVVRASGTEPKLKVYLAVVEPVSGLGDVPRARSRAARELDDLRKAMAAVLHVG